MADSSHKNPEVSPQVEKALIDDAVKVLQNNMTVVENRYKRSTYGESKQEADFYKVARQDAASNPEVFLPLVDSSGGHENNLIPALKDAKTIGSAIVHQCVSGQQFLSRASDGQPEILEAHQDMSGHKTVVEHYKLPVVPLPLSNPSYEVREVDSVQACSNIVSNLGKSQVTKTPSK